MIPDTCYFCQQPAQVELGRNSYLVDCPHCSISYEMDETAWATRAPHLEEVLAFVRLQRQHGQQRPRVALEHVTG